MKGTVQSVNVLRQTVKVVVNLEGDDLEVREYPIDELKYRPRRRKDKNSKEIESEVREKDKGERKKRRQKRQSGKTEKKKTTKRITKRIMKRITKKTA